MSTLCAGHLPTIGDAQLQLKKLTDKHNLRKCMGRGYLRSASWELAQRRRACSEKYDTATRATPAIFFRKNSEKLTCIEGLSLSLTRSMTPKIPKRKGTLTTKPAKRVDSFAFIVVGVFVVGVFVVGVVRRLASLGCSVPVTASPCAH